ncbi:MAG: sigma-70 family RNA polymerase sigma factor [Planctomycetota bacterium]|nr:sigma-70 family RNA polymerase sigma factor [Planctomycetota bacterium]
MQHRQAAVRRPVGGFAIAVGKSEKSGPPVGSNSNDAGKSAGVSAGRRDEDTALMLEFQAGREDAFRRIVSRNQKKVYGIIFRIIGNHAQTEDLTQEVFLRVFRTAGRYKPMAKFTTWLYRIATNVALNAIRAGKKARVLSLEMSDGDDGSTRRRDIPDTGASAPSARLDVGELKAKIAAAIDALPENQKASFVLNKYEHLNYQEIAEILECSTMAVKSLLSRARCNLRDALRGYLGDEFLENLPNP